MTLSDEFNNLDIIEELIENSKDIINFNDEIKLILQRAKLAATGGLKFDEKREFTTNQSATIYNSSKRTICGDIPIIW